MQMSDNLMLFCFQIIYMGVATFAPSTALEGGMTVMKCILFTPFFTPTTKTFIGNDIFQSRDFQIGQQS